MGYGTTSHTDPSRTYISPKFIGIMALTLFALIAGASLAIFDPIVVTAVVVLVVMAVLLIYFPFLGIYAYIVFEYASLTQMFESIQVLQVGKILMVSILLAFLVNRRFVSGKAILSDRATLLLFAWVVAGFLSWLFAVLQDAALMGAIDLAKWALTAFLIANLLDTLPKWLGAVGIYLLLNLKMSQFQIRGWLMGVETTANRDFFIREGLGSGSNAFFGNAGDFGVAMCVAVPFAFYLFKAARKNFLKLVGLGITGSLVASIIMSGARGNSVGLFAMVFVVWMRSSKKALGIILVVLFTMGYWAAAPDVMKGRFSSAVDPNQDSTASDRLEKWMAGLEMLATHPLTGVGINNFAYHYVRSGYADHGSLAATAAHNLFVQAFTETGLVGITVLVWVMIIIYKRNREARELYFDENRSNPWIVNASYAVDTSLVGYAVAGSFLTVLYFPHFFLLIGLSLSLNHIARERAAMGVDDIRPAVVH